MFSNPDFSARHAVRRARTGLLGSIVAVALAACSAASVGKSAASASATPSAPSETACPEPSPRATLLHAEAPLATDAVAHLLDYVERVRAMPLTELRQEITRLGDGSSPAEQIQLSVVLSQLFQLPELIRAQDLLARVLANEGAEARPLHALGRLLAARYGDQRRLEEQLEKQIQQTKDVQRKLDQTNERLEAIKAIERSLTSRPLESKSVTPARRSIRTPAP